MMLCPPVSGTPGESLMDMDCIVSGVAAVGGVLPGDPPGAPDEVPPAEGLAPEDGPEDPVKGAGFGEPGAVAELGGVEGGV